MKKRLIDHQNERYKGLSRSGIRDLILGFQDGLVNTLGLVLGVASAVQDTKIVLISGLAATFAESISMAAVAYTSSKAANEFYQSQLEKEKRAAWLIILLNQFFFSFKTNIGGIDYSQTRIFQHKHQTRFINFFVSCQFFTFAIMSP